MEDQRILDDLNLIPEDFDEEALQADVSVPSDLASGSGTASSSVIVPSFNDSPDISMSLQHGRTGGIPWFEEMVEGSRLGRLMRAGRGMGISDDQTTTVQWEFSEWHDDGTGSFLQQDPDSGVHVKGKRKRVGQADFEMGAPSKRPE